MIVSPDQQFTDDKGRMTTRSFLWADDVTKLDILVGTGSPEGVVEAQQKRLYMDDAGVAGAILYIKRNDNIGGDKSQGWILI